MIISWASRMVVMIALLGVGCSTLLPEIEQISQSSTDRHTFQMFDRDLDPQDLSVMPRTESPITRSELMYKPPVAILLPEGGESVDMRFRHVPLHIFNRVIADLTGMNIIVHHTVPEKYITINLDSIPWREAFQMSMRAHGLQARYQNNVIVIFPADQENEATMDSPLQTSHTQLYKLFYSQPDHLKAIIEPLFSEEKNKPSFSIDKRTRTLIVQGSVEHLKLLDALIEKLDIPIRQVRIEAFIVEAGDDFERSFGTRLGVNRLGTDDNLLIAGVAGGAPAADGNIDIGGNSGLAVDLPLANPNAGIGFLLNSARLKFELTALENEGKSRIVSNPKIFTLDNQEAVIFQGDEVPYFTVSENGTQTQFKEAGIRLAVTPSIIGNDSLLLDISVNKDTVDTRLENPPITRRQVSTKLKIPDGTMVVIGGIYFNTKVDTKEGVPVLSKIPIAGALFRRSQKTRDIKELLVFISPRII